MPFRRKILPFKSRWTFVFLIFTATQCAADDDHEMEEFLKREYSLSKPYQGNATRSTPREVLQDGGRCFQNNGSCSDRLGFCTFKINSSVLSLIYLIFHSTSMFIPVCFLPKEGVLFSIYRVPRLTGVFCAESAVRMTMVFVCSGVGSLGTSHWELMGDAMVTTEQVRLTPDMQSRQGAVWSRIVSIHN